MQLPSQYKPVTQVLYGVLDTATQCCYFASGNLDKPTLDYTTFYISKPI